MRRFPVILLAVALLLIAVLAAGCAGRDAPKATPEGHDLHGAFTLHGQLGEEIVALNADANPDPGYVLCAGMGGYDDVDAGLGVTVTNESGTIIGTGQLDVGSLTRKGCVLRFVVRRLPRASFYQVEVGHRGATKYSYADLDGQNWTLDLTLG